MAESKDLSFNIVVIAGEIATGKSVFIHRFATSTYKLLGHTVGCGYYEKSISLDKTIVQLNIWDTNSLGGTRSLLPVYLDGTENCDKKVNRVFVGLKCDLRHNRAVLKEDAQEFANKHKMKYVEASALTGENVEDVYYSLAEDIKRRQEQEMESKSRDRARKAKTKPRLKRVKQRKQQNLTRSPNIPVTENQQTFKEVHEKLELLGLETTEDLQEIMKLGTYRCYGNRIFLVGQFSVGKTTLAKVLIGEELPTHRGATDGIWIHIGKAGMNLEDKKWLTLPQGSSNLDIIAGMLISLQKQDKEGIQAEEQCSYSVESYEQPDVSKAEKEMHDATDKPKEVKTTQPSSDISVTDEIHAKVSVPPKSVETTTYDQPNEQLLLRSLLSSNVPQWKLKNLIFQAIKEGKYKQNLVFFDIWDFGGQKEFYMTHQLFITSRGIFVLMFNACHSLRLETDSSIASHHETSAAVYLVHWVNSILTYCKKIRYGFPRILLVATHKDRIQKDKIESCREKLTESLDQLFKSHAGLAHLEYKPLIFINATDINDPEIDLLRQRLIDRASDHPRWGEEMPTAWVPLELQIAEQVELGKNIISIQQLHELNSKNESMVLSEKQLNTFLKVQHSRGKLLFFDEINLRDYIIINPVFLIEVLRSIITDKQFWPKEETLVKIFRSLQDTGRIERIDLIVLWNQEAFKHIVPYKDFMINILVYLDILVPPQNPTQDENLAAGDEYHFFVPCMIRKHDNTNYMTSRCSSKNSIIMAYRFVEEVIPPALIYRFLASMVTMWEIKTYKGSNMAFSNLVVVEVDENHDVAVHVKGRRIVLLIHTEDVAHIVPTLASSVQECLTAAVHRISEFYSLLSEDGDQNAKYSTPFEIDFGVICEGLFRKSVCFFPHRDMPTTGRRTWVCPHGTSHDVQNLSMWFAEKVSCERCEDNCGGLGRLELEQCPLDKHIIRLVAEIEPYKCRDVVVNLGVTVNTWENLEYQFQHQNPNDLKFIAVLKWKEGNKDASFSQLQEALENCNINKHILCQILRDSDPNSGITKHCLEKTPSKSVLKYISNHIGDSSLQLGIELGLGISEIQHIQHQFKDKLLDQTREILRRWKQNQSQPTVDNLVKALFRIGKANCLKGVQF
ncbi:uncharacterized protein LOC134718688 isoform X2 [Mytilus trossulus]|uniref:uncharacterized protein LOC134718688 isoform X2 n=1 Tax=Mytilus trossulus TaxID=6551 RepID=UPI0030042A16